MGHVWAKWSKKQKQWVLLITNFYYESLVFSLAYCSIFARIMGAQTKEDLYHGVILYTGKNINDDQTSNTNEFPMNNAS